jgi:hypothetical protein
MTTSAAPYWLPKLFAKFYNAIQSGGTPVPQQPTLNLLAPLTAVDDPSNLSTDVGFLSPGPSGNVLTSNGTAWTSAAPGTGGSFTDPAILDGSSITPTSLASTTANIVGAFLRSLQTTNATPVAAVAISLPGTSGTVLGSAAAVPGAGGVWIDVHVEMVSKTTAAKATFKFSWGWAVQAPGSPVAEGSLISTVSTGTNSGAPPAGWAATMGLDGTSHNAVITVTGDSALVVNCGIRGEAWYVE